MAILRKVLYSLAPLIGQNVKKLKNLHKNDTCYIFGDGVSLKWFDIGAFPKKPTFTLGLMPFHNEAESLDIRYSLCIEPRYFYKYYKVNSKPKKLWYNEIQKNLYRPYIRDNSNINFFVNLSNYPVLRKKNIFYTFYKIRDEDFEFQRHCILENENVYRGSLRAAIALAIYMGFQEIYLVGCDYTHSTAKSNHWYEKGEGILTPHPGYLETYFKIAQNYTKLITVTLDQKGGVLPSISYTNLTGKVPRYRENYELISRRNLVTLSSWEGYNIF